jgi:hypothetical protein
MKVAPCGTALVRDVAAVSVVIMDRGYSPRDRASVVALRLGTGRVLAVDADR